MAPAALSGGDTWQQALSPATAAKLFMRLKLRLLANSLRRGWQHVVALVLSVLMGIPAALTAAVVLALVLRRFPEVGGPLVVGCLVVLFVAWAVGPLVGFGTDETLDPSRLGLLPLGPAQLLAGMFAASVVGVGPLATLLVLAGVVAGMAPPGPGAVVTVAAAVVHFALCLTFSRALTTALSRVLRSRRAQDLMILLGTVFGGAVALLAQVPNLLGEQLTRGVPRVLGSVADVLGLTPPGLAGRAMLEARDGNLLPAVAALLGAGAVVVLLGWWWRRSLQQLTTRADPESGRQREGRRVDLFPRWLSFLPRGPLGAIAAKELHYVLREPRLRANLVMVVVFAAALPLVAAFVDALRSPELVLAALGLAWAGTVTSLNALGVDGRAYWIQAISGVGARTELAGRNLASALVSLVLVVASAVALAAVTGGWVYVPVTVCAAAALVGVMLGIGDVVSVRAPQPLPEGSANVWSTSTTGQGCGAVAIQSLAMLVQGIVLLPVAALVVVGIVAWPPALALACPVALAEGAAVWRLGRNLAAGWLDTHHAELVQMFDSARTG